MVPMGHERDLTSKQRTSSRSINQPQRVELPNLPGKQVVLPNPCLFTKQRQFAVVKVSMIIRNVSDYYWWCSC